MNRNHYTADQLKDMAADYFTSNPDVDYLVASTHDGIFYRPENAGYAQSGANANGGELIKVTREAETKVLVGNSVNINVGSFLAGAASKINDLAGFFAGHLARVANGEDSAKVLADVLAAVAPEVPVVNELEEAPATSLADVVADALHLPGFFAEPTPAAEASGSTEKATTATVAPAPAPKKPRAKAAPKTKASTKAA